MKKLTVYVAVPMILGAVLVACGGDEDQVDLTEASPAAVEATAEPAA